jgi:hypothetical protein
MPEPLPPNIELLINLLNYIDANDTIDLDDQRNPHPLVEAVVYLATESLTTDDSDSYQNKLCLRNAGYTISPAETDSFGWLTAWIHLKRGDILFG